MFNVLSKHWSLFYFDHLFLVRSKQPRPRKSRGGRVPVWSDKPKVARKTAPSTEVRKYYSETDSDATDTDMESAIAAVAAANAAHVANSNQAANSNHGEEVEVNKKWW